MRICVMQELMEQEQVEWEVALGYGREAVACVARLHEDAQQEAEERAKVPTPACAARIPSAVPGSNGRVASPASWRQRILVCLLVALRQDMIMMSWRL